MTDVLSTRVLVLNRYFQPIRLTTAKRAFILLYGGAALAVDEEGEAYDFDAWFKLPVREQDDVLPIVGGALRVPRIVHLARYELIPRAPVRLTRRNLMLRDEFQCQYCAKRPPVRDLNIDHILPRSRGGPDTWENLVTACRTCNLRKGYRTPEEAGMRLLRKPQCPRWTMMAQLRLEARHYYFKEWDLFLRAG